MGRNQDLKQNKSVGEMFSEILVEGTKREGFNILWQFTRGELFEAGQFFLNELQK